MAYISLNGLGLAYGSNGTFRDPGSGSIRTVAPVPDEVRIKYLEAKIAEMEEPLSVYPPPPPIEELSVTTLPLDSRLRPPGGDVTAPSVDIGQPVTVDQKREVLSDVVSPSTVVVKTKSVYDVDGEAEGGDGGGGLLVAALAVLPFIL